MKFGNNEIELKLSALAAERIEEKFDRPMDEIFKEDMKFRAADISFILWAMAITDLTLDEFKIQMAVYYTYSESIAILTETLKTPNADTIPD